MTKLAIFASGSGSNAENLIRYFANHSGIRIALVLSNIKTAKVLQRAEKLNIPSCVFHKDDLYNTEGVLYKLSAYQIDRIILAGFLWLIPNSLLAAFPDRIINIHPALLPKYGGKGMYGMRVHQAVVANAEEKTGITIHLVNAEYDCGKFLFQAHCRVTPQDTPESVAAKVHELEYEHFPKVVEAWINNELKT